MAGISGMSTTFNTPNFSGELFGLTPEDTPFLSSIGGINGGMETTAVEFEWQSYDLRDPDAARQRLEGADAPGAEERTRANYSNILEVHQEAVLVSYTAEAARGRRNGLNVADNDDSGVGSETTWQLEQSIKQVKRDVEASFLAGTYNKPSDNTGARRTRGIIPAITSNVVAETAPTSGTIGDTKPITKKHIDDLVEKTYTNGGLTDGDSRVLMVPPKYRAAISNLYADQFGKFTETSRNQAGVAVKQIETDFGMLWLMTNRHLAQLAPNTLLMLSMEQCHPVFLNIPGKGHFFLEELAKTGASTKYQLYGEIGLAYGNEKNHGKLTFAAKTS